MELTQSQIAAAIDSIREKVGSAQRYYHEHAFEGNPFGEQSAEWNLEGAYAGLIVLTEAIGLPSLRAEISRTLVEAKQRGLTDAKRGGPDDDYYLTWASPAIHYATALAETFGVESSQTVTRGLEAIIRASTHSLSDPRAFGGPPSSEADLQARLEAILRCSFPDLIHRPSLTKPIKNFEPDTAIPSIRTLLEYKFISTPNQVAPISDQILADTRGYTSKDWDSFVYVIYETGRFRPEAAWRHHLRDCGVGNDTAVVLLSGETRQPHPSAQGTAVPRGTA